MSYEDQLKEAKLSFFKADKKGKKYFATAKDGKLIFKRYTIIKRYADLLYINGKVYRRIYEREEFLCN